jgi:signal transduction histidine kinase
MSLPIRWRLSLWYIALLTGTMLLFGGGLYAAVHYSLYSEVNRSLERSANEAVAALEAALAAREEAERAGRPLSQEIRIQAASGIVAEPNIYLELLINGTVADKSSNLGDETLPISEAALASIREGESFLTRTTLGDVPISLLLEPVVVDEGVIYTVVVARTLSDIQAALDWLAFFIFSGIGLTLILATIPAAWLAERAIEPVDAVSGAALRISRAEDLTRRLPSHQPMDEIGRLVGAFNEMLGRLDDVFRDQQRFVADVSHELRTPLTALQGNIELLKRGAFDDPVEREQALDTIESEVARLNRLVADLLLLARLEGGEQLAQEVVELDTLLLDVFRQGYLLAQAADDSVKLRLGHEDQATVLGDPDRLRQLLLNLVDNAIKYTQEGTVTLSLWKDEAAGTVRVVVEDTGIGIPRDSISLLFRRFYRTDKARSRRLGGTGLGLSISQWIVQAHGGTITVESEEGSGSTFTITLPLPTPAEIAAARGSTGSYRAPYPNGATSKESPDHASLSRTRSS